MDFCTIVARNYVPFARVLAASAAERRPGARCFVLVVDDPAGYVDSANEPFELVTSGEIGLDRFPLMAGMYDILELSTAVKPWFMRHLMEDRGADRLLYLDPDIRLFDPLDELDALLGRGKLLLTPHLTEPMPRDGATPDEQDILTAGSYNLGFLGLPKGPAATMLLDWWTERLATDCIVDPANGFFVDQRWIDFLPSLSDEVHLVRDPGYNVAYWNLATRAVRKARGGGYEVNGQPLRFFHFSGYDPRDPTRLSKHQSRIDFVGEPALKELCDAYGADLLTAGYEEAATWPLGYTDLPDGIPLDRPLRRTFRAGVIAGDLTESPFTAGGEAALLEWANGPAEAGGGHGVTRYLAAYHSLHPKLPEQMPDLDGFDGPRLAAWADTYGRGLIPEALMPGSGHGPGMLPGVNLAGYFDASMGVGEAGRQVNDALGAQGVPIALTGLVAGGIPGGEREDARERGDAPHAITLLCVNADAVAHIAQDLGHRFFEGRYTIGLWWWEVDSFPDRWNDAFDHVDEVWGATDHIVDVLSTVSPVPVVKVTLPVELPEFEPLSRAQLGLPEGFLFLFVFDYLSVAERKNPLGLVEAFTRAFGPGDDAKLVIKSINDYADPEAHARLKEAAAAHPGVQLVDRHVPRAEKDAMIGACDAYVSLHRSEGFGLTMAEAMLLGKPVIATGYSGNLDFMTPENSFLVDYELVDVGPGHDPYPADAHWADPDLDQAAAHMRTVFGDRAAAAARAERGTADVRRTHSREAAGKSMVRRLVRVRSFAASRGLRGPLRVADTSKATELVSSGPSQGAPPSRFAGIKLSARQAMLRVLKPYTVHQQRVDNELLRAIHTLDRSVQAIAATQTDVDHALAELRASAYTPRTPLELSSHPEAGIVAGYTDRGVAPAPAPEPGEDWVMRMTGGAEPVVDLSPGAGGADVTGAGAVIARGAVELLHDDAVGDFAKGAYAKLRPGGVFVVEGINPQSPRGAKLLATTARQVRGVYPEQIIDACRDAGFAEAFVFYPDGVGTVEADRDREATYIVCATRTA